MKEKFKKSLKITLMFVVLIAIFVVICKFVIPSISIALEEQANLIVQAKLDKYVNYNISEQDKGTLVQYGVRHILKYEENVENYPISQNQLTINLNSLEGEFPADVKIIAKTLKEDSYSYAYNREIGQIAIIAEKPTNYEEYIMLCYYNVNVSDTVEKDLTLNMFDKAILDTGYGVILDAEGTFEAKVTENIQTLTSLSYQTDKIHNGYIKSNILNETDYDTNYNQNLNIMISKKEAAGELQILETTENAIYKSSKLSKENIVGILGEEGTIEILDAESNVLVKIDKETEFDEQGNFTFVYPNEINSIAIKTSTAQNEGTLKIENAKTIKSETTDIKEVKTTAKINGIEQIEKEEITSIEEIKTDVKVELDNTNWTNKQQNEVTFIATIDTNTIDKNLLKNPSVRIELPKEIEKIILRNYSATYTNGLTLSKPKLERYDNGKRVIVANLKGEQKEYSSNELGVKAEIKIATTIILKKDIENKDININAEFINNYTIDENKEKIKSQIPIRMENYKEENIIPKVTTMRVQSLTAIPSTTVEGLSMDVTPVRGDVNLTNNGTIYEGEFIKYNITLTNTSSTAIENVKIVGSVPDGTTYGEYDSNYEEWLRYSSYNFDANVREKEISVGTINPGKTVTKFYEVKVNDLANGEAQKQITSIIKAYANNVEANSYEITNVVKKAENKVYLSSANQNKDIYLYNYKVIISGNPNEDVTLKIKFPNGFTPDEYWINENYAHTNKIPEDNISEDNVVTLTLNPREEGYIIQGRYDPKVMEKQANSSTIECSTVATINDKYKSNEDRLLLSYRTINVVMTSENEGEEVQQGEEINYEITVSVDGKNTFENDFFSTVSLKLTDYLPDDVEPISVTYPNNSIDEHTLKFVEGPDITENIEGINYDEDGNKRANISLSLTIAQEPLNIKVKTKAGYVFQKTEITNSAKVEVDIDESEENNSEMEMEPKTSNIVTHTILPFMTTEEEQGEDPSDDPSENPTDDPSENPTENPTENPSEKPSENPSDPNSPNGKEKYTISGLAWNDKNEDGQKGNDEKTISGLETLLINIQTSNIVTTKTNSSGSYKFEGIETGKYVVIFKYDVSKYYVTDSGKQNKALQRDITIDGVNITAGITEEINLTSNTSNINIGLVESKEFDLKLDKYISKITVSTPDGTKQFNYNNEKLAKAEIRAKELEGATVLIEYKIVITNEGEVPARVNKVVDYLPKGLTFNSNLNKSWGRLSDGSLTNNSLSSKELKAGESAELKLVATKKMTSSNTGAFTNIAEIANATNTSNIQDKDSTPGNKNAEEDDYSSAEVIISVSTGAAIYISIGVVTVAIIALLIFLNLKFNIFKKINVKRLSMFFVVMLMMFAYGNKAVLGESFIWNGNNYNPSHNNAAGGVCFSGEGYSDAVHCQQEGADPLDGDYGRGTVISTNWGDWSDWSYRGYSSINLTNTSTETINVTASGNKYIYGPFTMNTTTGFEACTITAEDKNGAAIRGVAVCNNSGNSATISTGTGSKTFYISIPKSNVTNSVAKVTATAAGNYTRTRSRTGYQNKYWGVDYYQDVASWTYTPPTYGNESESGSRTRSVSWTRIIAGTLTINKTDIDTGAKLSGAKFKIYHDGKGWLKGIDGAYSYGSTKDDGQEYTTDSNGKIQLKVLGLGKYTVYETGTPTGYILSEQSNLTIGTKEIKHNSQDITFDATNKLYGSLTINKTDIDTGVNLSAVKFKIYYDGKINGTETKGWLKGRSGSYSYQSTMANGETYSTDSNGKIELTKLSQGSYTVYETEAPTGYTLSEQENYDSTNNRVTIGTKQITANSVNITFNATNKLYGSLTINKTDKDFPEIALDGAKFKIYYEGKIRGAATTAWLGYSNNQVTYDKDWDSAYEFETGRSYCGNTAATGVINLTRLTQGQYTVYETVAPPKYDITVQDNYDPTNKRIPIGSTTTIELGSKDITFNPTNRKLIKLSGYVWVDDIPGIYKNTGDLGDNKYTDSDQAVEGVTVSLKYKDPDTKEVEEIEPDNPTKTDENGRYQFERVNAHYLNNYYIEFDHSGDSSKTKINGTETNMKKYIPVEYNTEVTEGNTSKALYVGAYPPADPDLTGKANTYKDTPADGESTYGLSHYYDTNLYKDSTYTIEGLNLGLRETVDPEYRIEQDIAYVKIKYDGQKFKYIHGDAKREEVKNTPLVNWEGDGSYSQHIYPSEIAGNFADNGKNLEVYVVYKIQIKNPDRTKIPGLYEEKTLNVTSLTETIADEYEFMDSEDEGFNDTIDNKFDSSEVQNDIRNWKKSGNNAEYKSEFTVDHGDPKNIHIQFKLKDEVLKKILGGEQKEITQEIATAKAYHSYERTDYGWFSNSLYEDATHTTTEITRTAKAYGIIFKLPEDRERTVSGTVFEDKPTAQKLNGNEFVGNGEKDTREATIGNVKVELHSIKADGTIDENVAKIYPYEKNKNVDLLINGKDATETTAAGGTYSFEGVTPGKYIVRFIYGNGNQYDVEAYKSTIVTLESAKNAHKEESGNGTNNHNGEWYKYNDSSNTAIDKYTYSVAVDNLDTRRKINHPQEGQTGPTQINADTPKSAITIENIIEYEAEASKVANGVKSAFEGFNLGIIKNPQPTAEIEKVITKVKLVNAQENVVFDGNPEKEEMAGVSDLDSEDNDGSRFTRIEIPAETIYGSTLETTYEIRLKNTSYDNYVETKNKYIGWYYMYGEHDQEYSKKVELNSDSIDYLDQTVTYESSSENLNITKEEETGDDPFEYKEILKIIVDNIPAQATKKFNIVTKRVLSSEDDDMEIINHIKVEKLLKTVQDMTREQIEGAYNDKTPEGESLKLVRQPEIPKPAEARTTITPPTGEDRQSTTIYIIAGTIALVILSAGIVIIKKKIL